MSAFQSMRRPKINFGDRPFGDGQRVSLDRWNKHSPPHERLFGCVVVSQRTTIGCESGWMVTIRSSNGITRELDSNWITAENEENE